jgi:hypothetical protein
VRYGLLVISLLLLTSCAADGTKAGPVLIDGMQARLLDGDPCMWNGDSGCTDHSLHGDDRALCVRRGDRLQVDAGPGTTRVTASAGERGDHEWIERRVTKGRVGLETERVDARRYAIAIPRDIPANLRVLHLDVRYGRGVLTPYAPVSEMTTADDPKPFKRGVYAVRIRVGSC